MPHVWAWMRGVIQRPLWHLKFQVSREYFSEEKTFNMNPKSTEDGTSETGLGARYT